MKTRCQVYNVQDWTQKYAYLAILWMIFLGIFMTNVTRKSRIHFPTVYLICSHLKNGKTNCAIIWIYGIVGTFFWYNNFGVLAVSHLDSTLWKFNLSRVDQIWLSQLFWGSLRQCKLSKSWSLILKVLDCAI